MKTNIGLVDCVKKYIGYDYWYGCYGQIATSELYNQKKKQYPQYYKWSYKLTDLGKRVFDCVGLIKFYLWWTGTKIVYNSSQDVSANGMYEKASVKGKIKNMPETLGLLVWKNGHIGVYIGNGYVVEARGHNYGVIKSRLKDGGWTNWCQCPYIKYISSTTSKPKPTVKPSVKYFKKYNGSSSSIVDALKSIIASSNYSYRKKIAKANGIKGYLGKASQNTKMLYLLKQGKLIKP